MAQIRSISPVGKLLLQPASKRQVKGSHLGRKLCSPKLTSHRNTGKTLFNPWQRGHAGPGHLGTYPWSFVLGAWRYASWSDLPRFRFLQIIGMQCFPALQRVRVCMCVPCSLPCFVWQLKSRKVLLKQLHLFTSQKCLLLQILICTARDWVSFPLKAELYSSEEKSSHSLLEKGKTGGKQERVIHTLNTSAEPSTLQLLLAPIFGQPMT